MINKLMMEKGFTKYRLAKLSGVPYMTVNDICNGKTDLKKASAETVYRLAKSLNVTIEELLEPYMEKRIDFDLFKSNVCHIVELEGDLQFVLETLKEDKVGFYYRKKWYQEALYMLGMIDYLSRINDIPLCTKYDHIRDMKLEEPIYPASLKMYAIVKDDERILQEALKNAIPEFARFNIVESEIRNVV